MSALALADPTRKWDALVFLRHQLSNASTLPVIADTLPFDVQAHTSHFYDMLRQYQHCEGLATYLGARIVGMYVSSWRAADEGTLFQVEAMLGHIQAQKIPYLLASDRFRLSVYTWKGGLVKDALARLNCRLVTEHSILSAPGPSIWPEPGRRGGRMKPLRVVDAQDKG